MNLSKMIKNVNFNLKRHAPEILTVIGIGGMVGTVILSVRVTPKAIRLLEEESKRKGDELTATEKVKTTWKCYIPAAVTGVTSISCLIGANSMNVRRQAALATAYTLSETALSEYKNKVVETIGEKKEQTIRDSIAKDRIENNPLSKNEVIITNKGDTLCYDSLSGRYFRSNIEKLKRVENEINRRLLHEDYISLNEFYYEIGLSETTMGSYLGWNISRGLVTFAFSSQLADDGTPCLVLDFDISPGYTYNNF